VIAKSDLFILVLSASLLAVGIARWQSNVSKMEQVHAQQTLNAPAASSRSNGPAVSALGENNNAIRTTVTTVTGIQTSSSASAPVSVDTPVNATQSSQAAVPVTQLAEPLYGTYTVVAGDYLSKIAVQYGTTVQTLQDINNIQGTLIDVGQQLRYPLPAN